MSRPGAPIGDAEPTSHPQRWAIFGATAIGVFMATIDGSIVNIALPTLSRELDAPPSLITWVVLAYLLTVTSVLLTLGRLADMYGRKPIYVGGFALFTLGSLLCGLAPTAPLLIAARVVQGLGAAMLFAIGPAIIADAFSPAERGRALGLIGTVVAAGSSVGPTVGGLLLSLTSWPVIFFINLPIGLVAIVYSWRVLPAVPGQGRQRFDVGGAVLFFFGVIALLLALSLGPEWGWTAPLILGLTALAVALLALFGVWEARQPDPMLDLNLFRSRPFTTSLAAAVLSFVALSSTFLLLPFYLTEVLAAPDWQVGLTLLASSLTLSIMAPLGGSLTDRFGPRWPTTIGLLVTIAALLLLSRLGVDGTPWQVAWPMLLLGIGGGLFQSPNSTIIFGSAPPQRRGVVSSLLAFARNLGLVVGTALGSALWLSGRLAAAAAAGVPPEAPAAQVAGMQLAYLVMAALIVLALGLSL